MAGRRPMLSRDEVETMRQDIAALLVDSGAGLSQETRARWQGALTAIEIILGGAPSLPAEDVRAGVFAIL